jgi:hypothetical protein
MCEKISVEKLNQLTRSNNVMHEIKVMDETPIRQKPRRIQYHKQKELREMLQEMYQSMITLLGKPFRTATFDFGDDDYFKQIFEMGEGLSKNKELRKVNNARGSKHAIYIMRTFFGLYSLLNQLRAEVTLNYTLD